MEMRHRAWLVGLWLFLHSAAGLSEEKHDYPECTSKPTDADVESAMGAFKAGKAFYDEGNRERAILYWEDAYRMDCTAHDLLLNLATVYELQGEKEQALLALQTYLKRVPDSQKQEQVTRRIEQLQAQVEVERAKEQGSRQSFAPSSDATAAPAITDSSPSESQTPAAARSAGQQPNKPPPDGSRSLGPLIVASAGGAVALVGVGMLAVATGDLRKYEKECGSSRGECPSSATADAANSAAQRQKTAGAITIVGAAVAAGGIVWFLAAKPASKASSQPQSLARGIHHRLTLGASPVVGWVFAGLEFTGTF